VIAISPCTHVGRALSPAKPVGKGAYRVLNPTELRPRRSERPSWRVRALKDIKQFPDKLVPSNN